ncbi:hypothetical protein PJJ30_24150 [Mycobacterium kansasii]
MPATPHTHDYLGRALTNATPGTSMAKDFLGRDVVDPDLSPTSDGDETDFVGRALNTP